MSSLFNVGPLYARVGSKFVKVGVTGLEVERLRSGNKRLEAPLPPIGQRIKFLWWDNEYGLIGEVTSHANCAPYHFEVTVARSKDVFVIHVRSIIKFLPPRNKKVERVIYFEPACPAWHPDWFKVGACCTSRENGWDGEVVGFIRINKLEHGVVRCNDGKTRNLPLTTMLQPITKP